MYKIVNEVVLSNGDLEARYIETFNTDYIEITVTELDLDGGECASCVLTLDEWEQLKQLK